MQPTWSGTIALIFAALLAKVHSTPPKWSEAEVSVSRKDEIIATLQFGNPPQTLRCLVDSGSADLWIPSQRCMNCGSKHLFVAGQSSTFWPLLEQAPTGMVPEKVVIKYGSGIVAGYRVQETVSMGGATVHNQTFLLVEEAQVPPDANWDGILGLSWESLARVGAPLYKTLAASGVHPIFAFMPESAGHGRITVGELPASAIKPGSLSWVSAKRQGSVASYWVANGGLAIHLAHPRPTRYIVDTGTNFLLAPEKDYASLMASLIPKHVFEHSCQWDLKTQLSICLCDVASNPDLLPLRFYLGDEQPQHVYELHMRELFMETGTTADGKELCVLQVQPNLLGDIDKPPSTPPPAGSGIVGPSGLSPPGVLGAPMAIPGIPVGAAGPADTASGGKSCVSEVIIENGVVKENKTVCTQNRRLTEEAGTWILGGVFLDHFVVVFDFEQERLGFAYPAKPAQTGGAAAKWDATGTGSSTLFRFELQPQWLLAAAVALIAVLALTKFGRARGNVSQQLDRLEDEETCLE
mmetsp:Transcript_49363/g.115428  ORF Transcript_49363/g.115428 Transcript_49363/m.115428 type:complete len:523 (-) Transcript_49363:223-1791(-)